MKDYSVNFLIINFMKVKKSPKANLETKKMTWHLMGYVIVLSLMFVAFEWSERDKKIDLSGQVQDIVAEEEMIPITEQQATPPPPPPPQEVQKVEEVLRIVENDVQVEATEIASSEDDNTAVEIKEVAAPVVVEEVVEEEIFQVVEEMPSFPGGMGELMKFLGNNIKYPAVAQENGIQGRVIIQFVVEKDGSVANPVVVKGVDPALDKEALRVVKSMPNWTPGKQRGKAVRVKYTVPVTFRLQ